MKSLSWNIENTLKYTVNLTVPSTLQNFDIFFILIGLELKKINQNNRNPDLLDMQLTRFKIFYSVFVIKTSKTFDL